MSPPTASLGFEFANIGKLSSSRRTLPIVALKLPSYPESISPAVDKNFSTEFEVAGRIFAFEIKDYDSETVTFSLKEK